MTYYAAALRVWRSGRPISTTLAMKLAALGYDVPALEARYLAI